VQVCMSSINKPKNCLTLPNLQHENDSSFYFGNGINAVCALIDSLN